MTRLTISDWEELRRQGTAYGKLRHIYNESVQIGVMTRQEADAVRNRLRREIRADMRKLGLPLRE